MAMPFTADPLARVAPASKPSSINEQISCGPKLKAILAMYGAMKIICTMPKAAPMTAANMVMPSATPPRPCLVMGKPSRHVTACGGWQGRFSKMEQIAPPYWAP